MLILKTYITIYYVVFFIRVEEMLIDLQGGGVVKVSTYAAPSHSNPTVLLWKKVWLLLYSFQDKSV